MKRSKFSEEQVRMPCARPRPGRPWRMSVGSSA